MEARRPYEARQPHLERKAATTHRGSWSGRTYSNRAAMTHRGGENGRTYKMPLITDADFDHTDAENVKAAVKRASTRTIQLRISKFISHVIFLKFFENHSTISTAIRRDPRCNFHFFAKSTTRVCKRKVPKTMSPGNLWNLWKLLK